MNINDIFSFHENGVKIFRRIRTAIEIECNVLSSFLLQQLANNPKKTFHHSSMMVYHVKLLMLNCPSCKNGKRSQDYTRWLNIIYYYVRSVLFYIFLYFLKPFLARVKYNMYKVFILFD